METCVLPCSGLTHGSAGDFSVHGVLTGMVTPDGTALSPAHTALWPHTLCVEQGLWGLWGDCHGEKAVWHQWGDCHAPVGSATHGSGLSFTFWCWQPRELRQAEPRSLGQCGSLQGGLWVHPAHAPAEQGIQPLGRGGLHRKGRVTGTLEGRDRGRERTSPTCLLLPSL